MRTGGLKYMQVWVADRVGNISDFPYKARINYVPGAETGAQDRVGRGQTRFYRVNLTTNERLTVQINPTSGDPDVYVWPSDWESAGRPPWVSNREGLVDEETSFVAPVDGVYQIEIFGYVASEYAIATTIQPAGLLGKWYTRQYQLLDKETPIAPAVDMSSEPLGAQSFAVPAAPPKLDTVEYNIYLPIVMKNS